MIFHGDSKKRNENSKIETNKTDRSADVSPVPACLAWWGPAPPSSHAVAPHSCPTTTTMIRSERQKKVWKLFEFFFWKSLLCSVRIRKRVLVNVWSSLPRTRRWQLYVQGFYTYFTREIFVLQTRRSGSIILHFDWGLRLSFFYEGFIHTLYPGDFVSSTEAWDWVFAHVRSGGPQEGF